MLFQDILNELPGALAGVSVDRGTILFVIDHESFADGGDYHTGTLRTTLEGAGFKVEVWQRKPNVVETHLLPSLLARYGQLWFFLQSMQPADELTQPEVDALWDWMDRGGGVLITGDHAECEQDSGCTREKLKGLGGPIGSRVPRAGAMRMWDGPPGSKDALGKHDSTANGAVGEDFDPVPQRLLLSPPFHLVFADGAYYLPDHAHEGVVMPRPVTGTEWFRDPDDATRSFKQPRIIARGIDWCRGESFPLMAAWEGQFGFGNILADASWHHYVEYNVAPLRGPAREKVLELYRNQAQWLIPLKPRAALLAAALVQVLRSPAVVESIYIKPRELGEFALKQLSRSLQGALFQELRTAFHEQAAAAGEAVAESLKDPTIEAHVIGAQVRLLAQHIASGDNLAALKTDEFGAEVLQDALRTYELELKTRMERLTELKYLATPSPPAGDT